jgi:predicted phage tail component-like protein
MAKYNSKVNYNEGIKGSGANYNSATFFVVEVSDTGKASEFVSIAASMTVAPDSGSGTDSVKTRQYVMDKYMVVTTENKLEPLGVIVLGDSRKELMPQTRDNSEEIPGKHGEIDFGTEFQARVMELHVATDEGLSPSEKRRYERKIAMYLNPISGTKKLVFLDDPDVEYEVKYAGKIDPTNYPTWFDFTIPFKMPNPFINSFDGHSLIGSGTVTNEGSIETGLVIEITGEATNPEITIGNETLKYTGTISSGDTLIIDTEKQTAKIGSTNAMANYNGVFPMLQPGDVAVTASENVTVKWKDKWI